MRESILVLAAASGGAGGALDPTNKRSLNQILQQYRTGTHQMTKWNQPCSLPSDDDLGPITTHLKYELPKYLSKLKLHEVKEKGSDEGGAKPKAMKDFKESVDMYEPDYVRVYDMLEAAQAVMWKSGFGGVNTFNVISSLFASYKLLVHCMNEVMDGMPARSGYHEMIHMIMQEI